MKPFTIILAEDHKAFRNLLRLELTCIPDLEVVGEVEDGLQLLELLDQVQPDLVILDISMPRMGGLAAARIIKQQRGHIKLLFLTMHKSPAYVEQASLIGAEGYLLKDKVGQELLPAIDLIKGGKRYLSSCLPQQFWNCAAA